MSGIKSTQELLADLVDKQDKCLSELRLLNSRSLAIVEGLVFIAEHHGSSGQGEMYRSDVRELTALVSGLARPAQAPRKQGRVKR